MDKKILDFIMDNYFRKIWLLGHACYDLFERYPVENHIPDVEKFIKEEWEKEWHKYSFDGHFYLGGDNPDMSIDYGELIKKYC